MGEAGEDGGIIDGPVLIRDLAGPVVEIDGDRAEAAGVVLGGDADGGPRGDVVIDDEVAAKFFTQTPAWNNSGWCPVTTRGAPGATDPGRSRPIRAW
jgi:hypothetical protein